MKTIEDRARTAHLRSSVTPLTITSAHAVGYIQGATEQRDIDIEKACEWLREHRCDWDETSDGNRAFEEAFVKAMKGE